MYVVQDNRRWCQKSFSLLFAFVFVFTLARALVKQCNVVHHYNYTIYIISCEL